jgi:ferredoxin-nitrite reductase
VPVKVGLTSGEQLVAVAELASELGQDVRVTRQQNFVLTSISTADVDRVGERLAELGLPLTGNPLRAEAIACTGEPHCNFSVTETKPRLDRLVQRLEDRFGDDLAGLRLHLDGCPHACAQHWVGDLGFQGTTLRDEEGKRRQAYDVFLRGGLGPRAAIARPVFRRVPTEELDETVERLVGGWLAARDGGEDFRAFCDRTSDDELGVLVGREPARAREKESEAA